MTFARIKNGDPRIAVAVEHHKRLWDLPPSAKPAATQWFGVFDGDRLLVVFGEAQNGEYREVTDMYPMPDAGDEGKRACYLIIESYKDAMARGEKLMIRVLAKNIPMQRAVAKVLGIEPKTYLYFWP